MTKYVDAGDVDLDEEVVCDSNGNRITEARAEEMATAAVRTVRGGRPSLTGGSTHSPQVSFRVPEQLRRRAEQRAEAEGTTVSQLAREALERMIDSDVA